MSFGLSLILGLVIAGTLLALLLIILYWYVFGRVLARSAGEERVAGLAAPAEVVRDRHGVPHIYARNLTDLLFAQGYVQAQDRLWQMEYGRRLAAGTLAEIVGRAALEADRWSRTLGFRRAAQRDLEALDDAHQAMLAAYAAGVNAFVEANRLRLPAEFTLLGFKPEPWTAQDSLGILKILGWALSQNWESELLRLQFLQKLGPERAMELDALYPAHSHIIVPPQDGSAEQDLALGAGRLLDSYRDLGQWLGQGPLGSNNWVVGPSKTTTRRPLLANDPHLLVSMPAIWYLNHLAAADGSLQVTGASLAGVPGILLGHNGRIAWGVTAGRADNQDLYIEQRHPDLPHSFRYGEGWEAAKVFREEIRIRGHEEAHVEEVVVTRHGPLVDHLARPSGDSVPLPPLALRWSGFEPSRAFPATVALQQAGDWNEFRAALALGGEPSMNLVYADAAGNIGYQYVARVPLRQAGHGLTPVPGWTGDREWLGYVPFDDLPSLYNPASGQALSANNKPLAERAGGPFLGAEWYPGYRATRIERMLAARPRFSVREFQRMQTDVYSVQAEQLVPLMLTVDSDHPLERRILEELDAWNLRVEVDSFAAAAYEVMRLHLLDLVFSDKLGDLAGQFKGKANSDVFAASGFAGRAGVCLTNLLEQEQSWWFHDAASGQPRSREQLLKLALSRTATTLRELIGKDPRKWAWGKAHQISFDHLLGGVRGLGALLNRGRYPVGGDEHTVWMTNYELKLPFGLVTATANYRQVIDVGDWDRSTAILCTGNSGQPGSRHYADHIEMWREGDQNPMLWSREAVDAAAESTLWLLPVDG